MGEKGVDKMLGTGDGNCGFWVDHQAKKPRRLGLTKEKHKGNRVMKSTRGVRGVRTIDLLSKE